MNASRNRPGWFAALGNVYSRPRYRKRSAAIPLNMKPETCLIVGVCFYFLTTALNRFLGERNYKSLTQEDKLKLTDAFSTHRSLATYIPIGIMVAVIAIGYANPKTFVVAFPVGVVLVLIVSLTLQIAILRRLSKLSLPDEYVNKFRLQSTLVQIGNLWHFRCSLTVSSACSLNSRN